MKRMQMEESLSKSTLTIMTFKSLRRCFWRATRTTLTMTTTTTTTTTTKDKMLLFFVALCFIVATASFRATMLLGRSIFVGTGIGGVGGSNNGPKPPHSSMMLAAPESPYAPLGFEIPMPATESTAITVERVPWIRRPASRSVSEENESENEKEQEHQALWSFDLGAVHPMRKMHAESRWQDRRYHRVIELRPDEHLLYQGRQKALCKLLRKIERHETAEQHQQQQRQAKRRNKRREPNRANRKDKHKGSNHDDQDDNDAAGVGRERVLLNMTTSCVDWGNKHTIGSIGAGNVMLGLYAVRLAAAAHGFDFFFRCVEDTRVDGAHYGRRGDDNDDDDDDDHDTDVAAAVVENSGADGRNKNNINSKPYRWMQGYFHAEDVPLRLKRRRITYDPPFPHRNETCRGMGYNPVHYMSEHIRDELRAMAVDIFGPRQNLPGSEAYQHVRAQSNRQHRPPPLSTVPLDDVAIHLRCGDVIYVGGSHYGFLPFRSYASRIHHSFSGTIGIVTTPFDPTHLRSNDKPTAKPCQRIVQSLARYLRSSLPHATVTIRNGPEDSPSVSMARLVMAKTAMFCGPSTFGALPSVASFGSMVYVHAGTTNYFITEVASVYDNVKIMNEPILTSARMKKMGFASTMQWLLADE